MITILAFAIFIYSVILHEMAHGLVAEHLGDPTARLSKRLTLNPLPHIDWFMSLLLPLFLIFSGSPIIFGAAKPVPIDPYNLKDPRKNMGLIGLAGPATNLLLALLFAAIAHFSTSLFPSNFLSSLLFYAVRINIILAVFNLVPIPPLDGGRILTAVLPDKQASAVSSVEPFGMFILIFLLLFPTRLFSLQNVIIKITSFIFGLIFPGSPFV